MSLRWVIAITEIFPADVPLASNVAVFIAATEAVAPVIASIKFAVQVAALEAAAPAPVATPALMVSVFQQANGAAAAATMCPALMFPGMIEQAAAMMIGITKEQKPKMIRAQTSAPPEFVLTAAAYLCARLCPQLVRQSALMLICLAVQMAAADLAALVLLVTLVLADNVFLCRLDRQNAQAVKRGPALLPVIVREFKLVLAVFGDLVLKTLPVPATNVYQE